MNFSTQVKNTLLQDISDMSLTPWLYANNPEKDFTRTRKMGFKDLLTFLVSMGTDSTRQELLHYFSFDSATLSNSAFIQQRHKLRPDTLRTLFQTFNSHYPTTLYKNKYQLLACDGSSFTFTKNPLDPESYYPPNGRSSKGYNQIHVVALFDLLSKRYADAVIQPVRRKNEFLAMAQLIKRFNSDASTPIFIADRGFHAYNVFAHAIEKNCYFIIRATDIKTHRLLGDDDPQQDSFDICVTRFLTRTHASKKRKHPDLADQYRYISQNVTFDFISDENPEYEIPLRVLRFKISEDGFENIITNLPQKSFPMDEIKQLYHLRWGIETSFLKLKHTIGAQYFHSKRKNSIEHEVWARLILFNFCSIITEHVVITQKKRKHTYQVNFTVAFKACIYFLSLKPGESPPDIKGLIAQNILPVRPDRNYARQHRFQVPVSFTYRL